MLICRFIIICSWFCVFYAGFVYGDIKREVPLQLNYCGIELNFTASARASLQKIVDKITKNEFYYQQYIEKSAIYMPFVDEAFELVGVPKDLRYIVIQESGLVGDAVSSSNAVGFWQFKDYSGREVGLLIDNNIDERKHIFRASVAAARYFQKQYQRHPNWVYAVIAYYAGGSGALPFVNQDYMGAKEMIVGDDLHWYAMKAIAHKIAYEPDINKNKTASIWLEPMPNKSEYDVSKLAAAHGLSVSEFKKYNLWISTPNLPPNRPFSYYIPRSEQPNKRIGDPCAEYFMKETYDNSKIEPDVVASRDWDKVMAEQNMQEDENEEVEVIKPDTLTKPSANTPPTKTKRPHLQTISRDSVIIKDIETEPLYREEMVMMSKDNTIEEIARGIDVSESKLRKWNGLRGGQNPLPGQMIMLVNPRKAHIHIAKQYETVQEIADFYHHSADRINSLNHLGFKKGEVLKAGQKIYLRKMRPLDEPTVLLQPRKYNQTPPPPTKKKPNPAIKSTFPPIIKSIAPEQVIKKDSIVTSPVGRDMPISTTNGVAISKEQRTENQITPPTPVPPKPVVIEPIKKVESLNESDFNKPKIEEKEVLTTEPKETPVIVIQRIEPQKLPSKPEPRKESFTEHLIEKGDNLSKIANRYRMTLKELKDLNGLTTDAIRIGDRLKVKK